MEMEMEMEMDWIRNLRLDAMKRHVERETDLCLAILVVGLIATIALGVLGLPYLACGIWTAACCIVAYLISTRRRRIFKRFGLME